ncbi:MAG: cupin [Opitutaceae bacterium]
MNSAPGVMRFLFEDAGEVPNNRTLPLLVYKRAVALAGEDDPAAVIEKLLPKGGWRGAWRWGVYPFPHYHSTAHEVLGVYRGHATLRLGHSTGVEIVAEAGDVIVIPAGVGHQNLGASADFHVVGGYPEGQSADLLRGHRGERPDADRRIQSVPLPAGDPVKGASGPLIEAWRLIR